MIGLRSTQDLGLKPDFIGKVRDIFDLSDHLMIVTTDRVSAFDIVMDDIVPGRGIVLNAMSLGWFNAFDQKIPNHVVTADADDFPAPFNRHADVLRGRALLVHKANRFPVECVVRGYIAGSGWKSYQSDGQICGHKLPAGLQLASRLPEPIFTPSTKADSGHDENISLAEVARMIGEGNAKKLEEISLALYSAAAEKAAAKGVIIADTKFEFGMVGDELTLIDEALTPDSSRFWPADTYAEGKEPDSWDKQILRNYLESCGWNKEAPPPAIPEDVLLKTFARYREVLEILFPQEAEKWL